MKTRISIKNGETSAEYSRLKTKGALRKGVLVYLLEEAKYKCVLYIDTNNGLEKVDKKNINEILNKFASSHVIEEVKSTEKKLMGVSMPFVRKKNKQAAKKDYRMVFQISSNEEAEKLYDSLLYKFDYALCMGDELQPEKVFNILRKGAVEVLFNKEIFSNTFYDSIVVSRMRIDKEDEELKKMIIQLV